MRPIFHRHYRPFVPSNPHFSIPKHQTQATFSPPLFKFLSLNTISTFPVEEKPELSPSESRNRNRNRNRRMAQRTEKEETEFKVPETITLCVNNCGVTGNPATNNMCQNCFNASTTATTTSASTANLMFSGDKSPMSSSSFPLVRSDNPAVSSRKITMESTRSEEQALFAARRVVNRCSGCRRKVGLTGFRCRCGELFCAEHRYSDRHVCSYDYKAAGREAIARENPVVKAAKIVRV